MADITIVTGAYKPTYNWGAPSCSMDSIEPLPFAFQVGRNQHQARTLESLATPDGKWLAMAINCAVDSKHFGRGGFSHLHQYYTNLDSAKKSSAISYRIHGAAIYGVPWIPSIYPQSC